MPQTRMARRHCITLPKTITSVSCTRSWRTQRTLMLRATAVRRHERVVDVLLAAGANVNGGDITQIDDTVRRSLP